MSDTKDYSKYKDKYSESGFWAKLRNCAKKIGAETVYNALLLYYVMADDATPWTVKGQIAGALGYLIFPFDLIPDALPVVGFTDDAAAIAWAINQCQAYITPAIRSRARARADSLFY